MSLESEDRIKNSIYDELYSNGSLWFNQLKQRVIDQTGTTPMTFLSRLKEMEKDGIVQKQHNGKGKKSFYHLKLNLEGPRDFIPIDLTDISMPSWHWVDEFMARVKGIDRRPPLSIMDQAYGMFMVATLISLNKLEIYLSPARKDKHKLKAALDFFQGAEDLLYLYAARLQNNDELLSLVDVMRRKESAILVEKLKKLVKPGTRGARK